ncbi:MAG: ABC transporter ATP-binding protein [Bacteroidetes bacterium HGW-Bacteroidetes-1]|jgi:peptide/nickel transport system ATP-binding protein|nr:MAG: ABC transporter ATP-binding protein [Bacteroidetes bacterium HGW-Bacteroidetes-1]
MKSKLLLHVNKLCVSFRHEGSWVEAVRDVSFDVERGKTLGIVGESGSGKSVSSLAVMGLLPLRQTSVAADSIQLNGSKLSLFSDEQMRQIRGSKMAMIFQEPMTSLNPVLRCGFQVAEAIRTHQKVYKKEARKKVLDLFRKVKLPRPEQNYKAYPHQLSGGQKQRVMIAMALANEPDLLIADEPTTALDVTVQKEILLLLKDLQQQTGMGMIFISHDLAVIADIADKVAVMHKGQIVESGTVTEVLENPQHAYTRGLLACRPPLNIRLTRLPVVREFLENKWPGGISEMHSELAVRENDRSIAHQLLYRRKPLLKVENLQTWFPVHNVFFSRDKSYVKAVDNISFEVFPGETLGLVGESGCGKTTLGRSILRLQEPTQGVVSYKGVVINKMDKSTLRDFRKKLQIIFQDPYSSLNPRMAIGDAIMEPMKVHGLNGKYSQRMDKVYELLEQVGLEAEHYRRYPHEFSGGQRQRVCIARALAVNPELVICDEPVSALDVSVQAQVLNLLNRLKKEFGFTYIFISHDLSVVRYMSDRVLVMNNGKSEELAEADFLYENPQTEYTKKLIAAIPGRR